MNRTVMGWIRPSRLMELASSCCAAGSTVLRGCDGSGRISESSMEKAPVSRRLLSAGPVVGAVCSLSSELRRFVYAASDLSVAVSRLFLRTVLNLVEEPPGDAGFFTGG